MPAAKPLGNGTADSYALWWQNGSLYCTFNDANGSGPFLIQNNYLEGAGENVIFGGGDPSIANLVPSDIQILGNTFRVILRGPRAARSRDGLQIWYDGKRETRSTSTT